VIRAAEVSDCVGIATLINLPIVRAGTLSLPYQNAELVRKQLGAQSGGSFRIVAVQGDEIVGQAGLRRFSDRRSHAASLGLGVHDDHQGRGIGTALLKAIIDTADNWLGLTRLELTVFADNAPAIHLYEKFGFIVEGTHRAFAFRAGAFADALAMARIKALK
jgi:putative acetyltransferase